MVEDNPSWGYAPIEGALKHPDHRVARSTTARTLKKHGIKPSPERPMSWATFVRSHAHLIAAADFFTTEVWTARFKSILSSSGVEILLTAYQAPNMNAYAERFIRSIKSECIGQMIFLGQRSLDHAIHEFAEHYHDERSHQGIGNRLVSGAVPQSEGSIEVRQRLGGTLNYYHRRAA